MKNLLFILLAIVLVALGVSSCSPSVYPVLQSTPTIQATPTYAINDACEQVIVKFLQANPCKHWDEFHSLFTPDSRHFQVTPMASNDPACDLKASRTILRIMPADEWWQLDNPNQPIPDAAKPESPNEYVFFVESETQWQPGVVPPGANPAGMLIWMVFDNDNGTCLIREFGW
jgi:hypothetical protein